MKYVWINPVSDSMYGENVLDTFLKEHGFKRLVTKEDWLSVVKEKYCAIAKTGKHPVMDVRCPKVKKLLEEQQINQPVIIPEIAPILIHCGQEASQQLELKNAKKIITTPCQALADLGNHLALEDTCFMTWNQFLDVVGARPQGNVPERSPIPPGYFEDLGLKSVSITGEEEIKRYLEKEMTPEIQLVEMLFCKEGCHNGDGIGR